MTIDADNMPDFLAGMAAEPRFSHGFGNWRGDFEGWRAAGRDLLRRGVGPALDGEAVAEEIGRSDAGGVTRLRLRLRFPTGARSEALMLLPSGAGPRPAVLLQHDHGSEFAIGKEKMIAPWDDPERAGVAREWQERLYGGVALGQALAARGFVVIAADALGWGSRVGNGYAAQQALACNLMQFGLTLAGIIAAEDAQLARWLARHPAVDRTCVSVLGFSFGGFRAWQAMALEPAIRAGVAAGWMARLADLMVPGGNQTRGQSAFTMLHPGLGGRLDYPDVAGLAAPRRLRLVSGAEDRHVPEAAARQAFGDLARIWAAAGAPRALETEIAPGGHVFTAEQQARAIAFLARN
ncbi:dienelactone hydrolase family protein [Amaricoccus solimangrovi]|uniref:Hydrolase n=1 Tax=Amaricoccus solimangrovi TaxID=2589815 RepID=A0A501WXK8_9RHOB|nr:alpha/beta hydrolase family protein [Amaricoccus solimangrovi]TPE51701.1 hydrolase [Amaricoccus solimangrovi]